MQFKQKALGILLAAVLMAPVVPAPALAATGLIYITPASSSLQVGGSETLSLRINPGTTVDGVQATVSYNTSYLQLNSVDNSASPFSVQLQKSAGGGTITLALGNLSGGVSSDSLIATMNFTALAGSGSSSLVISNANATSSGSYTNPATANASVNFSSPSAPAPVAGSGGGSSAAHSSSGGSTKTAAPAAAAAQPAPGAAPATTAAASTPVHLKSKLAAVSYTSATVAVTSNQSLSLYALYGTDIHNLSSKTAAAGPGTKADLALGAGGTLAPGTTYYYQVIGQDANGGQTKLPVQAVTTAGFTVHVTVLDGHSQVLKHTPVTLHSRPQTATTDGNGVATFTDVAPGVHHVEYQTGGKSYAAIVYVENNLHSSQGGKAPTAAAQTAAVVLPLQPAGNGSSNLIAGAIIIALLAVLIAGAEFRHKLHPGQAAGKLAAAGRSLIF